MATAMSGFGSRLLPPSAIAPSTGCERSTESATLSSAIDRTRSAPPGSGSLVHVPSVFRIASAFATRATSTSPAGSGTAVTSAGASGVTAIGVDGVVGTGGGAPPPHAESATVDATRPTKSGEAGESRRAGHEKRIGRMRA